MVYKRFANQTVVLFAIVSTGNYEQDDHAYGTMSIVLFEASNFESFNKNVSCSGPWLFAWQVYLGGTFRRLSELKFLMSDTSKHMVRSMLLLYIT